jgi:signal transduction histidine kinase
MFLTLTGAIAIGIVAILILMWVSIHRVVLKPLTLVNQAVAESDRTGVFTMPANLPRNEIKFLARNFERVVKQLEAYDQLHKEIEQRKQVEAALRQSEARERAKSHELGQLVRELKQTQAQLVQTEKMSSLGRMVGGVAHEINNPVSFIFGNLTFAQEYFEQLVDLIELYQQSYPQPTPQIARRLDEVELEFLIDDTEKLFASMKVGAERIRDIVLSLRNFSRFDEAELKSVKIEEGLRNTLLILQPRLQGGSPVKIVTVEEFGDLPLVECYASQINQVFLNLLSNAIDALESDQRYRQGRELPVPATIWIRTEALNKKTIAVRVRDNGPGMPPEVREKAFDPFFTTKEIGKGTGLGLSISYQIIVEQHKGRLECISKPGEGTEFVIEIPTQIPRS